MTSYEAGDRAYWLGDFTRAIEKFEAAYEASQMPAILYNVGLAYMRRFEISGDSRDLLRAKERRRVYFLQRWPSTRSMTRVRQRVKEMTGRNRHGVKDVRVLIRDINPVLRGWGNYFRTGNAAKKFNQVDSYVRDRLWRFMVRRKGRHLRAGEAERWTFDFFHDHGLHRLRGTVKYPEAA